MLTVTESALTQLARALDEIDDPAARGACFRIAPDPSGRMKLTMDVPGEQDTVFERDGTTVLVLSPGVSERCSDRTLDASETGQLVLE